MEVLADRGLGAQPFRLWLFRQRAEIDLYELGTASHLLRFYMGLITEREAEGRTSTGFRDSVITAQSSAICRKCEYVSAQPVNSGPIPTFQRRFTMQALARLLIVVGLMAGMSLPVFAQGSNPPWPPKVSQASR